MQFVLYAVQIFQNGGKVCNFSIATSENWKDRNTGERQERTQWHNIAIFSEPISNVAEQYLKKGSKVYIEGQLETRKWQDQSGNDRYSTEVVIRPYGGSLTMLDSRSDGYGLSSDQESVQNQMSKPSSMQTEPNDSEGIGDLDDEIPF